MDPCVWDVVTTLELLTDYLLIDDMLNNIVLRHDTTLTTIQFERDQISRSSHGEDSLSFRRSACRLCVSQVRYLCTSTFQESLLRTRNIRAGSFGNS